MFCAATSADDAGPRSFTVRQFGAVGDGVHNDGPALQAAFDALRKARTGKLSFEPFAIYRTDKCLLCTGLSGAELDGQGATIRPLDDVSPLAATGETLELIRCANIKVHDVKFDGNKALRGPSKSQHAQASLDLWGCRDVEIHDCIFGDSVCDEIIMWATNGQDPLTACRWITVRNCRFLGGCYRHCIGVVHGQNVRIEGNEFRDRRGGMEEAAAIDIEANPPDADGINADIAVTDNVFDNCNLAVIVNSQRNPRHVGICRNRVSNGGLGLINWAKGTVIAQNTLHDMSRIAIGSGNGGTATIDGNRLDSCRDTGIFLDTGGAGQIVSNNVLTDVGIADQGLCIRTAPAGGGAVLRGNVVRSTNPRPNWVAYDHQPNDLMQNNEQYGCRGADGLSR